MNQVIKIELGICIILLSAGVLIGGAFLYSSWQSDEATEVAYETSVSDFEQQVIPATKKEPLAKNGVQSGKNDVALYMGSWFDVEYPRNFIADPQKTEVFNERSFVDTDEAYFVSPDGAVEFYVFSPLWSGDPNYLTVSSMEELVSQKTEESGFGLDKTIIQWITLKAKDGSYYRSYVSIKNQVDTGSDLHHVFGFKYRDNLAYEQYRDAYVSFKNSLRQYID